MKQNYIKQIIKEQINHISLKIKKYIKIIEKKVQILLSKNNIFLEDKMSLLNKFGPVMDALNSGLKNTQNACQKIFNYLSPSRITISQSTSLNKNINSSQTNKISTQFNKSNSPVILRRCSSSKRIIPLNIPRTRIKNVLQEQKKNLQKENQKKLNIQKKQLKVLQYKLQQERRRIQKEKKALEQVRSQKSLQKVSNKKQNEKLISLTCCLTAEIMENPFDLPCGHCFEEKPIKQWFQNNTTCPICHEQFLVEDLRQNQLCKRIIDQKIERKVAKSIQKKRSLEKLVQYENKQQLLKIGEAVIKNLPKHTKIFIQNSQQILSIMKRKQWCLNYQKYSKMNWQNIFPYMKQCSALNLFLSKNYRPQMLSQIKNASYVNLKELYLSQNNINNIQSLASIHFKRLIYLDLGNNNIVQIKCFKRLSISTLKKIRLYQNPLLEITDFTKALINPDNLVQLSLQNLQNQIAIHQDLTVMVKISTELIQNIFLNDEIRINPGKISKMLRSRFPSITFAQ